ncbi:MAG TPA: ABC transporter permease [Longimicrobiaceae bacterium]|nr:ABC transporter permease [Longimicrobiaceae bacterium]
MQRRFLRYLAFRIAGTLLVAIGILVITFVLTHVIPSDPARIAAGPHATAHQIAQARQELGLDQALPVQFIDFLGNMFRGDLGTSFVTQRPVSSDLEIYFPATLELVLCAMIVLGVAGIIGGILASLLGDGIGSISIRLVSLVGIAAPVFLTALLAQILFFGRLGWFPSSGRIGGDPPHEITHLYLVDSLITGNWSAFGDACFHLVLPVAVLAFSRVGVIMRLVQAEMTRVMKSEYIEAARAKGVVESRVIIRHAARNALLPTVSMLGMQFGWLLGGDVLVEAVFSWPGLGGYLVDSVGSLDVMPVIGTAVLLGFVFALVNLIVDIAQARLDPRIAV